MRFARSKFEIIIVRCGIVALAMAMKYQSNPVTVENLMLKAKELLYTIQGELFDGKHNLYYEKRNIIEINLARIIPNLCQEFNCNAKVHRWINPLDLLEYLDSQHVCLIP